MPPQTAVNVRLPESIDPEQASVFDEPIQKAMRMIADLLGLGEIDPTDMAPNTALMAAGGRAARAAARPAKRGIRAFHGTPHTFDRFDLSRVGTGEGAQAFGHGLYFAENPAVAREYQRSLVAARSIGAMPTWFKREMVEEITGSKVSDEVANEIVWAALDRGSPAEAATSVFARSREARRLGGRTATGPHPRIEAAIREIRARQPKGRLVEVNIDAAPEELLDLDLPLSRQSERVRGGAADVMGRPDPGFDTPGDRMTLGRDLVGHVLPGPPSRVSASLRNAGIPGSQFLDQMSRGSGEGTRNFVIFDDSIITILRNLAALIGAGGGAGLAATAGDDAADEN